MNHEAAAATICRQGREKGANFQGGAQKGRKRKTRERVYYCILVGYEDFYLLLKEGGNDIDFTKTHLM